MRKWELLVAQLGDRKGAHRVRVSGGERMGALRRSVG